MSTPPDAKVRVRGMPADWRSKTGRHRRQAVAVDPQQAQCTFARSAELPMRDPVDVLELDQQKPTRA